MNSNPGFALSRQHTDTFTGTDMALKRSQPFFTSSSGGLSDSSTRRRPNVNNSTTTGTRNRTEDEDNEFYISCAEIQSNNSSLMVQHNEYTGPTVHANKSAQTESSLFTKRDV